MLRKSNRHRKWKGIVSFGGLRGNIFGLSTNQNNYKSNGIVDLRKEMSLDTGYASNTYMFVSGRRK